jgi:hypothetical protein
MGSKLSKSQVDAICRRVYKRFPDLKGVRPRVKPERARDDRFQLLFKTTVALPDGPSLPITVRAIADENGRVLKLTSSR